MPEGFVRAIEVSEVPEEGVASARVGGVDLAIVRADGQFHALDALCPHQEGPLDEGYVAGGCLVCPWHNWEFDVRTGEYLDDPTPSVKRYETLVEDGAVYVRIADGTSP